MDVQTKIRIYSVLWPVMARERGYGIKYALQIDEIKQTVKILYLRLRWPLIPWDIPGKEHGRNKLWLHKERGKIKGTRKMLKGNSTLWMPTEQRTSSVEGSWARNSAGSFLRKAGWSYRGHSSFSGIGKEFFSFQKRLERLWGPPSLLFNGYWRSSPRGKAAGREADHSTPSTAQAANAELYLHFPHAFMPCTGTNLPSFHAVRLRFTLACTKHLDSYTDFQLSRWEAVHVKLSLSRRWRQIGGAEL